VEGIRQHDRYSLLIVEAKYFGADRTEYAWVHFFPREAAPRSRKRDELRSQREESWSTIWDANALAARNWRLPP